MEGPVGPAAFHWVDADGTIVTDTPELKYLDPSTGYLWNINVETGSLVGWRTPTDGSAFIASGNYSAKYFIGYGCTGLAYAWPIPPRVPFQYGTSTSNYFVRDDTAASVSVLVRSYSYDSGCFDNAMTQTLVPESELTDLGSATGPDLGFVGPLHPEL